MTTPRAASAAKPPSPSETATFPPPPAPAESETLAPSAPAGASPGRDSVPGYEILAELGRGGMGVVYQARQAKLGRIVALKMILTGAHASAADLARFRTEAEAIARLQHPNIVQIHEVGEHGGLPFFSLEFCAGGSLEKKLAVAPLPPRAAAVLVLTLARAMRAAHEKGVIHRDLKPANVLLAEDGTPKVTDFGLAKKLEEAGQTASGAVMGTPSYMAPEQAGGKAVGPLADVYALGAILYECLTGRPPFKAATALDTIMQVVADDPVPPTRLQSKTPRDLETICLKCLQKEPSRRYASAAALADDLGRFVEGRPVVARPVGPLERAAKWVRRQPALAGAIACVAAALILGAAVSTWFGIDASHQADKARGNEATANKNANDLKTANQDLARTADSLEETLARSLLRPLGLQAVNQPMTDPEWEALWELATNRRGRLGYRFVEEASRTPVTSRQLRDRAALALPAAVGLDAERRAEVEALLLARLDDPALGDEQKTDLALAASAWDGLMSSSGAGATARQLIRAMTTAREPGALYSLAQGLSAVSARLEAKDAAIFAAQAATTLVQAMKDAKNPDALLNLAFGLSALSARLEAKDAAIFAAQAATILVQAMKDAKSPFALQELAQGLSAVSARLDAKDAAQAAASLLAMTKTSDPAFAQSLSVVLSDNDPASQLVRGVHLSTAVASIAGCGQPLTALAPLIPAAEPLPCRLSTQQLIELLKMPTCVGPARRVVLDHLGNRYKRPFADVWEFVQYAKEQGLDLDFTSPAVRPDQDGAPAR